MAERGYGFWPVEVIGGAPFIGMVGLSNPDFHGALPARGRDWLAAGGRALGARLRDGGGAGRAGATASSGWACAEIVVVHDRGQRPLAPGDGEARHAALARRRFPAPVGSRGAPGCGPHVLYRLRRADFAPAPYAAEAPGRSRRRLFRRFSHLAFCEPWLRLPPRSLLACAALPLGACEHGIDLQGKVSVPTQVQQMFSAQHPGELVVRAQIPGQPDITVPSVILCGPAGGERVIDVQVREARVRERGHRAGVGVGDSAHGERGELHGAAAAPRPADAQQSSTRVAFARTVAPVSIATDGRRPRARTDRSRSR